MWRKRRRKGGSSTEGVKSRPYKRSKSRSEKGPDSGCSVPPVTGGCSITFQPFSSSLPLPCIGRGQRTAVCLPVGIVLGVAVSESQGSGFPAGPWVVTVALRREGVSEPVAGRASLEVEEPRDRTQGYSMPSLSLLPRQLELFVIRGIESLTSPVAPYTQSF